MGGLFVIEASNLRRGGRAQQGLPAGRSSSSPGQNDVLLGPITIEKPLQDGYITRFKPNLVAPSTARCRPSSEVHLHHGTWLNLTDNYGSGPFFAAGEEKTIAPFPRLRHADQGDRPVAAALHGPLGGAAARRRSTSPTTSTSSRRRRPRPPASCRRCPLWLDVRPSGYPVFNVQRLPTPATTATCTWPSEECAAFDPWGATVAGQGAPRHGPGTDRVACPPRAAAFGRDRELHRAGRIIGLGGHLHPGGLRTRSTSSATASRSASTRRSELLGPRRQDASRRPARLVGLLDEASPACPAGGSTSSRATCCAATRRTTPTLQSTYENMGIVVALLAPDDQNGEPAGAGREPVRAPRSTRRATATPAALAAPTADAVPERPSRDPRALRGERQLAAARGRLARPRVARSRRARTVDIADFLYMPGDLSHRGHARHPDR